LFSDFHRGITAAHHELRADSGDRRLDSTLGLAAAGCPGPQRLFFY